MFAKVIHNNRAARHGLAPLRTERAEWPTKYGRSEFAVISRTGARFFSFTTNFHCAICGKLVLLLDRCSVYRNHYEIDGKALMQWIPRFKHFGMNEMHAVRFNTWMVLSKSILSKALSNYNSLHIWTILVPHMTAMTVSMHTPKSGNYSSMFRTSATHQYNSLVRISRSAVTVTQSSKPASIQY